MGFKKYKRKGGKKGGNSSVGPRISLRKSGTMGINHHATAEYFSNANHVELLNDAVDEKVGLSPKKDETDYSYKVRKSDEEGHGSQVTCKNFLEEYDLIPEKTTRYQAQWDPEQELVYIDLKKRGNVYGSN